MISGINGNKYNKIQSVSGGAFKKFSTKMCEMPVKDSFEFGCTDGIDDGKISFAEKSVNFAKGVVSPVTAMFKSPKNFAIGAAAITSGVLLIAATAGAIIPLFAAAGFIAGAYTICVNAFKAANAKTDGEAKRAWCGIGTGAGYAAISLAGSKGVLKIKPGIIKAAVPGALALTAQNDLSKKSETPKARKEKFSEKPAAKPVEIKHTKAKPEEAQVEIVQVEIIPEVKDEILPEIAPAQEDKIATKPQIADEKLSEAIKAYEKRREAALSLEERVNNAKGCYNFEPSLIHSEARIAQLSELSEEQIAALDDEMIDRLVNNPAMPGKMVNFDFMKSLSPVAIVKVQNNYKAKNYLEMLLDGVFNTPKDYAALTAVISGVYKE